MNLQEEQYREEEAHLIKSHQLEQKTPSQSFEMECLEIKHFGVIKCAV